MYDYNCPDCNEAKLQSDKNARKINEVIEQVNALIEVNNETVDFIKEKVKEVIGDVEDGSGGGSTGGSLNLRDVLDGEIFTIGTIDTPTTPTVTYGQIVVSKSSTTITEGSTDTFTVKLDKAPTNNQVVTLNKNNSDVSLSSYSLTFTPSNYSTVQTVKITVAEDNDEYSDETCTITLSSPNVSTKTLIVNITDNDEEVIEPEEPDTPEEPSSATLIHEWDLTETGSTIEDKVNNLDLVVNGNKTQISRYDEQGTLNENFILTETESFSLDILATPKSVYSEEIIHTGHIAGISVHKGSGETNHYRFSFRRDISHGSNKGLLVIEYRLETDWSDIVTIENTQTTMNVQTNIKLVYNADKTELKVYQEDNLVFTDNRPYKISGFNFIIADYCKVYKGCII